MFFTKIKTWFASKLLAVCGFFVKLGKVMKAFFAKLLLELTKKIAEVVEVEDVPSNEDNSFRIEMKVSNDTGGDLCMFYVSEQVTRKSILSFSSSDSQKDEQTPMVKDLFQIRGVKSMWLTPYEVAIKKGHVFIWEDLGPKIEEVLRKHFQSI